MSSVSDMMPVHIERGLFITGVFRFTNNLSTSKGIYVGTRYRIEFPSEYKYVLFISNGIGAAQMAMFESGNFIYSRDGEGGRKYNSGGGFTRVATFEFFPDAACSAAEAVSWESVWTATDRFSGSFQSIYGIADFEFGGF